MRIKETKMTRNKSELKRIGKERVERLLDLASSVFDRRPELAHRYAELAWKIKTRYNLRLPKELKRKFCRRCQTFWVPGETCRVRLRSPNPPRIVITCLECGYKRRVPY